MSNEIMNSVAVELSSDELDTVAGGLSITLGNGQGFSSDANNTFTKKSLTVGQQTFAGPNGSFTSSMTNLEETISSAFQGIAIGN
ncbi:MAG: CTB family bacteriocin [Scytonematopsis contorta HA4267-MV1]|jgi:hypothetical protein|nr:CTB family bacteriocin [Scytonematopsis contorta HA4267-MV1]